MVKLSVIIPFFNSMKYIAQLVESIPQKDEIEIIITDDKSNTTETAQLKKYILAQQTSRKIQYFYNDETKSAGTCRNIGLRHAVGEWILFADADDYFMPGFYEKVSAWFTKPVDLVYFTPTSFDRLTKETTERHVQYQALIENWLETASSSAYIHMESYGVPPWLRLHRRSFLKEHQICFDQVLAANDVMFAMKAAFATDRIAASKEVIYCVTKSPGTLVFRTDKAVLDSRLNVFIRWCNFLQRHLSKSEFADIHMHGRGMVMRYIEHKYSLITIVGVTCKLLLHGVPMVKLSYFNPMVWVRAFKRHRVVLTKSDGYYKNNDVNAKSTM